MHTTKIESFKEEWRFLSNFWPAQVVYEGCLYASSEHAYQAAKTLDLEVRREFQDPGMKSGQAKRRGRQIKVRDDWEQVRVHVMHTIVLDKFTRNPELRDWLLATGDAELIEGNTWGDVFWGVCNGAGANNLGKILMAVRAEIGGSRAHSQD